MLGSTEEFRAAAIASNRSPVADVLVAWEKNIDPGVGFFTLDSSTLDGSDVLKSGGGDISDIFSYEYTDESDRVLSLEIQRSFEEPIASFSRAVMDVVFDNSDDRYTPNGGSAIDSYIKVNRPFQVKIGFDYGTREALSKFLGVNRTFPKISKNSATATFQALDLGWTVWNTPVEEFEMFVNMTGDQIIAELLEGAGILADQIDFDPGETVFSFAFFEPNTTLGQAIAKIAEADLAVFYFDERGIARYRARDWYARSESLSPFEITDDMVISESDDSPTNIINHVEITAKPRSIQSMQPVYSLGESIEIAPGETVSYFLEYKDPVMGVVQPTASGVNTSYFYANTDPNNNGIDYSSNISVETWDSFAKVTKATFKNNGSRFAYITDMRVYATPARGQDEAIVVREKDQDSIDEFGEYKVAIENDFIQSALQARNLASALIQDRKEPGLYRTVTMLGQPQLQLGDTISREGLNFVIIGMKEKLTPGDGLIQELSLVNRTITKYFRLDISMLDGPDTLAI